VRFVNNVILIPWGIRNSNQLIEALEQWCMQNDVINEEEELTSAEENDGEIELGGYPSSPVADNAVGDAEDDVTESELVRVLQEQREMEREQCEREKERWQMRGTVGTATDGGANAAVDMKEIKQLLQMLSNNEPISFFISYERVMQLNNAANALWPNFFRFSLRQQHCRPLAVCL